MPRDKECETQCTRTPRTRLPMSTRAYCDTTFAGVHRAALSYAVLRRHRSRCLALANGVGSVRQAGTPCVISGRSGLSRIRDSIPDGLCRSSLASTAQPLAKRQSPSIASEASMCFLRSASTDRESVLPALWRHPYGPDAGNFFNFEMQRYQGELS